MNMDPMEVIANKLPVFFLQNTTCKLELSHSPRFMGQERWFL